MSIFIDRLKNGKETKKNPLYDNRYSYGVINIDANKCTGCLKCQNECIVDAIQVKDSKAQYDYKKCIFCRNCLDICPSGALEMDNNYKLADFENAGNELKQEIYKRYNKSLVLRSVDTGSCNACMIETSAMQNTFYDISRFGISYAASPRHADGIVVTGPVAINMKEALIKTYYAMPKPRLVIAVGACAYNGGIFRDTYGNTEDLNKIIPVDLYVPGCPPSPQAIIYGLLKLMGKEI